MLLPAAAPSPNQIWSFFRQHATRSCPSSSLSKHTDMKAQLLSLAACQPLLQGFACALQHEAQACFQPGAPSSSFTSSCVPFTLFLHSSLPQLFAPGPAWEGLLLSLMSLLSAEHCSAPSSTLAGLTFSCCCKNSRSATALPSL